MTEQGRVLSVLTPEDTGCFTITTLNGTRHLFDLDRSEYVRNPSPSSRSARVVDGERVDLGGGFAGDGRVLHITSVVRWPAVGGSFFIWLGSEWRQSSRVVSIEPANDKDAPASTPPATAREQQGDDCLEAMNHWPLTVGPTADGLTWRECSYCGQLLGSAPPCPRCGQPMRPVEHDVVAWACDCQDQP